MHDAWMLFLNDKYVPSKINTDLEKKHITTFKSSDDLINHIRYLITICKNGDTISATLIHERED